MQTEELYDCGRIDGNAGKGDVETQKRQTGKDMDK
jgi:hypothetical protein